MKSEIEVFLMNDQPVTCPKCGTRTEFEEFLAIKNKSSVQIHQWLDTACQFQFKLVEY